MKREEVKSSDKVASVLSFTHSKLMPDFYISALNYRFYSAGLYAVYSSRLDKYFLIVAILRSVLLYSVAQNSLSSVR